MLVEFSEPMSQIVAKLQYLVSENNFQKSHMKGGLQDSV